MLPAWAMDKNKTRPTMLIVDDEPIIRTLCEELVSDCGFRPRSASTTEEAIQSLNQWEVDGLITDICVPEIGGIELIKRVRSGFPWVGIFALTQYGTIKTAVDAMRLGAVDYVEKPFLPEVFQNKLKSWLQCSRFDSTNRVEQCGLLGQAQKMLEVQEVIAKASQLTGSVLISGETGTGKEVAARCIHQLGPRAKYPFVPVDCASLTPSLIESELFGHVRGAFTGAVGQRQGLCQAADKGTLFLDEVGELRVDLQAKLLRVIQERQVRRVGSTETTPIDVRIIAATNRDLQGAIKQGTFRSDLYYRLAVMEIALPPLRERKTDIPLLIKAFLKKHADPDRAITSITDELSSHAMAFDWPGNVRELENFVERCVSLGSGPELRDELTSRILARTGQNMAECIGAEPLWVTEQRAILKALKDAEGDKLAASRLLGIGKTTLYRKLKKYGRSPEQSGISQ